MHLLVTAHSGAYFCDPRTGECDLLHPGYVYGADRLPSGDLLLAERDRSVPEGREPTILRRYDEEGALLTSSRADDILNVHQLTIIDHSIYICSTGNDTLVRFSTSDLSRADEVLKLSDSSTDTLHLNSVSAFGPYLLVMLHRRGDFPARIGSIAPDRHTTLINLHHRACHNVEVHEGYCYYNASSIGYVCRWNMNENDAPVEAVETGGHTKGMAISGGRVYAGVSGIASRTDRFTIESSIAVLDSASMDFIDMLPLRANGSPIGNINEVRVLP